MELVIFLYVCSAVFHSFALNMANSHTNFQRYILNIQNTAAPILLPEGYSSLSSSVSFSICKHPCSMHKNAVMPWELSGGARHEDF